MKSKTYDYYIDASTTRTGLTLVASDNNEIIVTHLDFSKVKYPSGNINVQNKILKFKYIKMTFDSLLQEYPCKDVYIEGVFVKPNFLHSSEVLIKLHGFLMLYFIDCKIEFFPPKTIKKELLKNGNGSKADLYNLIEEKYNLKCLNFDQSDSFAIMLYEHIIHNKEVSKNINIDNGYSIRIVH